MSDKHRRRELAGAVGRKIIIALLLVSAALLLARTGYYTGLKDLIRGDAAAAETESGAGAETPAVLYSAVRPRTVAVRQSDGTLLASAYDAETTARAFQRFSALLGEALGSAGTPLSLRRTEFQEGLSGSCVLFEMGSALPLGVLSGLLGTRMSSAAQSERAERIYLALRDDRVVLAFRTDTGAYYRCDTAAQAEALRSRIADFRAAKAVFAGDSTLYARLEPSTVILSEMPEIASISLETADADAEAVLAALGMNPYVAASYPESDGTLVFIEGEKTLRWDAAGVVTFRSGERNERVAEDLAGAVQYACRLAAATVGQTCGDAVLRVTGAAYDEGRDRFTVTLELNVNGLDVRLAAGAAAEVELTGGCLTRAQLTLRRCTAGENTELVLPMLQAAAIAAAEGNAAPVLVYRESGEGAGCGWVQEG